MWMGPIAASSSLYQITVYQITLGYLNIYNNAH